jgi:DNA modification methylase
MAISKEQPTVPITYVDLSEEEEALVLATIDPVSGMAVRDGEKLAELLAEINASDLGDLGVGLDDLLHTLDTACEADASAAGGEAEGEDEAPEPSGQPISQPGDLWLCGSHRVLCGDSTSTEAVSRLLSPASGMLQPFLMVTDPPYGVEYDPTWRDGKGGFSTAAVKQRGKVQNDDRVDWREAYEAFPGDVAYVWHGGIAAAEFAVSLLSAGFQIRGQIIWRKQQAVFSRGAYHWQHEPCWYAVRKGKTAHWHGDRKQSTVWDVQSLNPTGNRDEERVGHGTQKPVELMRRPILNHTERGEAVYDPFLGSGTTLIAAELTQRICYGLELDPVYVDVIVRRWEKQSGKQATLEGDGRTFSAIAAERAA